MTIPIVGQTNTPDPDCPVCHKEMMMIRGKKGIVFACESCKISIGVTDPLILQQNLFRASTMMNKGDTVIIGYLEWEVVMGKGDRDFLLRRPNPKDKKQMDFCMVEVIDFVFDKNIRKWIEVDALPEDGDSLFKK